MDKRLNEINLRLTEYSVGKFHNRLKLSEQLDETDAIINGINMLGEELKSITISRNYFNDIFNSVSDMVFILNSKGIIEEVNQTAILQLKYTRQWLIGRSINELNSVGSPCYKKILRQLKIKDSPISDDCIFLSCDRDFMPVRLKSIYFGNKKNGQILLTASDITYQLKTENLIIRAIIDTQEKERQRLAKDLHDSLTQQLAAIKFYISSTADLTTNRKQKEVLTKSNQALSEVISEVRSICFNLMPKTLEEFGLAKAVKEFCNHFLNQNQAKFAIVQRTRLPALPASLKIDLYRIIQEFITNSIKHGHATRITISFSYLKTNLKVILNDDGIGFKIDSVKYGMGLQNVQSRVKSHNGELSVTSACGKGTCFKIMIPVKTIRREGGKT